MELAKAQLIWQLTRTVKRLRLTRAAAAARLGIDQGRLCELLSGGSGRLSIGRLMRLLTLLGHDVDITVRAKP